MMMNEKLIHDYWQSTGQNMFPLFNVEIQCVAGGVVIFRESEPAVYGDFEQRTVDVLDILAWVYSITGCADEKKPH